MTSLIILGASTRAAAMSAIRAGHQPWCADLFADRDLCRLCPVERIPGSEYPHGFIDIVRKAPPGPWMYTGGLENHPRLVAEISKDRALLGTSAEALWHVRSPFAVAECLKEAGIAALQVADGIRKLRQDGRWLVKSLKGTGGRGITFWTGGPLKRGYFLQKFIKGDAVSAVFVAHGGTATFYGATRQLVGADWLRAAPFHYCGSIGPLPYMECAFEPIGRALTARFDLQGVFGVDCILREDIPYVIEVNPRYTASVEVLERSCPTPVLSLLVSRSPDDVGRVAHHSREKMFGKAVLYARERLTFLEEGPWEDDCSVADIPHPGQLIEKGKPILTVFAEGSTEEDCESNLRARVQKVEQLLFK